ncbi:M1 family metallopeptidase [Pacificimonas sp. WHA3]|uniref:M1 family metallopeptidase n=1 Tax=Pacificimonas pallii TaxID=2827236 RepID=A0ABS6SHW3_9SPHN|nr:M1 family metallopeptidase [Pacificimonas pallii]MBV7257506.1 M1 family metallopeptidase [Pacificimonas pallii]
MRFAFLAAMTAALIAGCSPETGTDEARSERAAPADVLTAPEAVDAWTYAVPNVARVTHVDLDLTANFETQRMSGTATLDLQVADGGEAVVLDDGGLEIDSVTDAHGKALAWSVGEADELLGAPLTIQLDGAEQVVITYTSAPAAAALQWLPKEATAGGRQPFLFSQGQAILNRTWIPTQDSPGIRQTWSAEITVPEGVIPVMSALSLTEDASGGPEDAGDGMMTYRFEMPNPVPPYLIAIAIGDLDFRELGPRSGVYAEAEIVDAAADEFADIEAMIDTAEALYGPYRWGRYDMLVLPPSFPYGGMENPNLSFLTPTLITGDRSNTDVVAHELAHSWSGNLVTNATWKDSWLNEGFTTYFENRIMEGLYGKDRADLYADLDYQEMLRILDEEGADAPTTRLHSDLSDGPARIQYFKGMTFLRTLERTVGREVWDAYLRAYFDRNAFQPQTTAGFLADLRANLIKGDAELEAKLKVDEWAYEPGLPDNAIAQRSTVLADVDAVRDAFVAGGAAADIDTRGWATQQWLRLLRGLPREQTDSRLQELDETLGLSTSNNAYVRSAWYEIAINNRYEPAVPSLKAYLNEVGRNLFLSPLYEGLVDQGDWGLEIARDAYATAKDGYHPLTQRAAEAALARGAP